MSVALNVSGQNSALLQELYQRAHFEKVCERFTYVLAEMDQKWMTSTEQSNKNSLPNLVIYLWGLAEEAATFKMHCGPCFPCSILQGYFCIQLEAELCEKLHVCLSNYLRFRNLPFSAVTKRIARIFDIKTESQKTFMVALPKENFQYSCQPQQNVTVRLIPPAPLHYPLSSVCSPNMESFFET